MKASLPVVALTLSVSALAVATPAQAVIFVFTGTLSGAAENPPNGSPGTGATIVTYDDAAHTLRVQTTFSGLLATTTASHIHIAPTFGANGGVATQTPSFAGFPLGVTSGSFDNVFDLTLASSWNPAFITANGGTVVGAEAAFATGLQAGLAYLNVHTGQFPGGEIRANLGAVPEPATWAMMIGGFALLGGAMRRRVVRASFA